MFRLSIFCKTAFMQIICNIFYAVAGLLKIFKRISEKFIVIGLEPELAAFLKISLVAEKLLRIGKSSLVVLAARPRIAEVDVDTVYNVVFIEDFINVFYVVYQKLYVFDLFYAGLFKLRNCLSSCVLP